MIVAIASDHRGYECKKRSIPILKKLGHDVQDFGCNTNASCDYPDFAAPAARAVADGRCEVAILFDGSGIGMSIVANKVPGVRAALAHDEVTASRAREHNHCNALCLGTDLLSEEHMRQIIEKFLETPCVNGRHDRRIAKIAQVEEESRTCPPSSSNGNGHPVAHARSFASPAAPQ